MMALPDAQETPQVMAMTMDMSLGASETVTPELSSEAKRIQRSYQHGLWSAALVKMAVQKGDITSAERDIILSE